MTSTSEPSEIWINLHYRYKGEMFRYNLPLPQGAKFLDGLRVDLEEIAIPGGRRYVLTLESLGIVEPTTFELTGRMDYGSDLKSVFVNGYQSWTVSRERYPGERISALDWPGRLLFLQNLGDARFFPYSEKKGRFHGYTYAYIRYLDRLMFVGSLDESVGFTVIRTDLRHNLFSIAKDLDGLQMNGRRILLDFVFLEGSEKEVFDEYTRLWSDRLPLESRNTIGPRAVAWTSGDFGRSLNEAAIRRILTEYRNRNIPLDYFNIGRGWQRNLGDWNEPATGFPSGMAGLAAEIKKSGYTPGLWMAPFVVGVDSSVFRIHNEWLARDSRGRIRPAGRHPRFGGLYYALDVSLPGVREHILHAITRIREEWGYELIEMDLLYAAALFPPEGMSRAEALDIAMDLLMTAKGGSLYRLNGVPLAGAFGRVEYCRIAADTTPYWEHRFHRNIHCRERTSTVNALRSTVGRRHLNGRLLSADTDAFYIGSGRKTMESRRRYTQLLLHALFGTFLCTSDDVSAYSEDEFRLFSSLFPKVSPFIDDVVESRRTVTIRYRVGKRSYFSISNLSERPRPFILPEGLWFRAPWLEQRPYHFPGGRKYTIKPGESWNCLLLDDHDAFAGCDGHLFPGAGTAHLSTEDSGWSVEACPEVCRDFRVWIRHDGNVPAFINGEKAEIVETPYGGRLITGIVQPPVREDGSD